MTSNPVPTGAPAAPATVARSVTNRFAERTLALVLLTASSTHQLGLQIRTVSAAYPSRMRRSSTGPCSTNRTGTALAESMLGIARRPAVLAFKRCYPLCPDRARIARTFAPTKYREKLHNIRSPFIGHAAAAYALLTACLTPRVRGGKGLPSASAPAPGTRVGGAPLDRLGRRHGAGQGYP